MGLIRDVAEYVMLDRKARDFPPDPIYAGSTTTRFTSRNAATHLSAYGGEQAIDWVMDCVRLIAESASNAEYHFLKEGKKLLPEKSPSDPKNPTVDEDLAALLREPNPYMDYTELVELTVIDILLAGEAFWHRHRIDPQTNRPLALYRLAPPLIDVLPGEERFVDGYEYRVPGKKPVRFGRDEVIHFKLPNPHNPYRGLGVIAGGPRVYDVELSMVEAEAQFFEQGTKLSGVLQTDRRVPEPVFKKIQRQFSTMYSGARNAYKVAVLEQGLRFQSIQPTAAEAQFEELSKLSRDRIAHMFRVPLPLIGNLENANYKMAEAQRIFDTKTMRPFLNKLQRSITRGLTDAWGVEFKIEYEYVMPDEDRLRLAESVAALPGIRVSEVRAQAGFDPLGDERDEIVLNLPVENEPLPPRGSEPGAPPNRNNVPGFPDPGQTLPPRTGDQQRPRTAASLGRKALFDPTNPDPLLDARTPVVDYYAHQIKVALETAAAALEIELTNIVRGRDAKAKEESLSAKVRASEAWKRFEGKVRKSLERNAEGAAREAVEQHRILGFSPDEELVDFDQMVDDLIGRKNGIKSIIGNLKKDVSKVVADGVRKGYTADQILHGEGEDYLGLRGMIIAWRRGQAETIALTEATEYYNEGILRTAEASGLDHVLVLDGEDWDEPCQKANGEVWSLSRARDNRTEHPRCRRAFFPVTVAAELPREGKAVGSKVVIEQPPAPDFKIEAPVSVNVPENPVTVNIPEQPAPHVEIRMPDPKPRERKSVTVNRDAETNAILGFKEVYDDGSGNLREVNVEAVRDDKNKLVGFREL